MSYLCPAESPGNASSKQCGFNVQIFTPRRKLAARSVDRKLVVSVRNECDVLLWRLRASSSIHTQRASDFTYKRADNSRPVSFTVSAWEWVYATNLSSLQRETRERSKQHLGEANCVLRAAILLLQCLSRYWGKTVSLRVLINLKLADFRLTTAQQRSTG
jgi:hypothetical protein